MNSLLIGSDNVVTLKDPTTGNGLYDSVAAAYVNSATVTGQLLNADETAVAGSGFTLAYVAASNGVYRGVLTNAVTSLLTQGGEYIVQVTAVNGSYQLVLQLECVADYAGRLNSECC